MDRLEDSQIQSKYSPDQPLNCCSGETGYQPILVLRRHKILLPALHAEITNVSSHRSTQCRTEKLYGFDDIRTFFFEGGLVLKSENDKIQTISSTLLYPSIPLSL